nr:hypothetical protein [Anaerolineae bacterium]
MSNTPSNNQGPSNGQVSRREWFRQIRLSNWQIILIALLVVGGRLILDFSQRIVEGQDKVDEQRLLEEALEQLRQEHQELEADKAYYGSSYFIEAWAHDEGKMVRDGEILVVPIYEQAPEIPVAETSETQAVSVRPWQIWWSLFFDSPPPFNPFP